MPLEPLLLARLSTRELYDQSQQMRTEARTLRNPQQRALSLREADQLLLSAAQRVRESPRTLSLKAQADAARVELVAASRAKSSDTSPDKTAQMQSAYTRYLAALDQLAQLALKQTDATTRPPRPTR